MQRNIEISLNASRAKGRATRRLIELVRILCLFVPLPEEVRGHSKHSDHDTDLGVIDSELIVICNERRVCLTQSGQEFLRNSETALTSSLKIRQRTAQVRLNPLVANPQKGA